MRKLRIGFLQQHNTADRRQNIERLADGIANLAERGAQLILRWVCEKPITVESLSWKLCAKLKSENPENFDPELLQKPSKLHISALIFDLKEDPIKVNQVCQIMKDLQDEIKNLAEGNVIYKFGGYGVFDSYEKARVIFSKMEEDSSYTKMEKIIDLIIKKLLQERIIDKKELQNLHVSNAGSKNDPFYKIEMHLTLMNTTFLNKVLKKQKKKPIKNFDATKINECISGEKLADCPLKKIDFCVLREDKSLRSFLSKIRTRYVDLPEQESMNINQLNSYYTTQDNTKN